jgi:Txe/YoeB family toxin of Txe-Axe toxin-antitoxin module
LTDLKHNSQTHERMTSKVDFQELYKEATETARKGIQKTERAPKNSPNWWKEELIEELTLTRLLHQGQMRDNANLGEQIQELVEENKKLREQVEPALKKVAKMTQNYNELVEHMAKEGFGIFVDSDESDCDSDEEDEMPPKEGDCCLCDGKYVFWGNNPAPLKSPDDGLPFTSHEKCCNRCNETKVIPARFGCYVK